MFSENRALISFVALAYFLSWSFWFFAPNVGGSVQFRTGHLSLDLPLKSLVTLLGDLGPGIAAIIVLVIDSGTKELRKLLPRLIPRSLKWTTVVLITPAAILICSLVCVGFSAYEFFSLGSAERWLRVFAVNLAFAPFWEELGWRGYLLPRLENVRKPMTASIAVGVIWGLWHTPLYFRVKIPGSPIGAFPICFFVLTLGLSILFSWIYNATKGNLSAVVLLHASFNSSIIVFLGRAIGAAGMKPFLAFTIGTWVTVLVLVFFVGLDLSCGNLRSGTSDS